jgi:hypothetical protein
MPPAPGLRAAGTTTSEAARPRYPWLTLRYSRAQWTALLVSLAAGVGLAYLYIMYMRTNDVSPDSVYGYGFAIAGTALFLLVGVVYALRKRLGRTWAGRLHTFLAWHIAGGILALVLILMHAAGNFNPRSGTYALYGLIGVVISGLIGRFLDRFSPRLAANAALQALTASGEERLDDLEEEMEAMTGSERARSQALHQSGTQGTPWDLAYYDLDPEVEEIPALLSQGVPSDTGPILDLRQLSGPLYVQRSQPLLSASASRQTTGALKRQAAALRGALGREQFYVQLVRVWRRVHILVSLVTLGLLIWHLEYAATLLIGAK